MNRGAASRGPHPRLAYLSNTRLPGRQPSLTFSTYAARGFVEAGADIRLVLRRVAREPARDILERATGIILPDVVGLYAPRIGGSLRLFYWRAYWQLRRSDRNILLFRDIKFLPWAVRLRRSGMRVFFEAHEYWGDAETRGEPISRSRRRGIRAAERWIEEVDGVFCTSGPQAELYRERFPGLAVELALTGTRFPKPNDRRGYSYLLGYFGSLHAQYPLDTVIAGLAACTNPRVRLLVVGARDPEERRRLESTAGVHDVADRVAVHEWVPPAELAAHRTRIDVGIVPLSDAFKTRTNTPLKLVDYLSESLPAIATRSEVVTAYVTDGREALLVENTAESWARAIDRMYHDFPAYEAMAAQALARARELTWTRRAVRMLDVMRASLE